MHGILPLGNQSSGMQACRSSEVVGKISGCTEHVTAAHAVADAAHGTSGCRRLGVQEIGGATHGAYDHRIGKRMEGFLHRRAGFLIEPIERDHPARGVAELKPHRSRAMIKIWDGAVVANGRDAPRNVELLL